MITTGLFAGLERLSRDDIRAIQLKKLQELVARAYDTNRYYRRLFHNAGIRPAHIRTLADYCRIVPPTRKQDILADQAEDLWGERLGVPAERVRQVSMTGGTSGRGQELHALTGFDIDTTATGHAWFCHTAGVRPGDRVANTFPVGLSAAGQWLYRSETTLGAVPIMLGMYDTSRKLREIERFGCSAAMGSTSYTLAMAMQAEHEGIDLPAGPVRRLLTAGEPYTAPMIERIEAAWGARMYVWYGSTQRVTAGTCERGAVTDGQLNILHVPEHLVHFEVVDPDTGEPVDYGHEGEMVHTFLHSQASPLLRYAGGDKVRLLEASHCPCGRGFDGIEGGTISRYDDMIKIKGVNIWPHQIDPLVLAPPEVAEYQGRVRIRHGREQACVYVEVDQALSGEAFVQLAGHIATSLREHTGVGFSVERATEALPRFADDQHKPRRWIDERATSS